MLHKFQLFIPILIVFTITPICSNALAGPYSDELSKCIIQSTTPTDRADLIKWMFSAISLHPVVDGMSSITQEQMNNTSMTAAKLFERLIVKDCIKQTRDAVQYEGTMAIETSFNLLGQVAAQEIFQHKNVATALADLEKHFDQAKFEERFKQSE